MGIVYLVPRDTLASSSTALQSLPVYLPKMCNFSTDTQV